MNEKISKGRGLAMRDDERKAAVSKISRAAREAMKEWKKENGIRAIVPKTKNEKIGLRQQNKRTRIRDRHLSKTTSLGAASEIRTIKPAE